MLSKGGLRGGRNTRGGCSPLNGRLLAPGAAGEGTFLLSLSPMATPTHESRGGASIWQLQQASRPCRPRRHACAAMGSTEHTGGTGEIMLERGEGGHGARQNNRRSWKARGRGSVLLVSKSSAYRNRSCPWSAATP